MNLGLNTYLYKEINEKGINISGGEAQKIAIARALYKNASFMILDEPTAGLDVIARDELLDMMRDYMAEDDQRAILISSHISSDL